LKEESAIQSELALQAMKKKQADAVAELSEQLEAMHRARTKAEKERQQRDRELEQFQSQLDFETKQRHNADRIAKQLEAQLLEVQSKADEQQHQLAELQSWKNRAQTEQSELSRQLEEAETQLGHVNRLKGQLGGQAEEMRRQLDQESRDRQALASQARWRLFSLGKCHSLCFQVSNYQLECQQMRDQLEEEQEAKSELQRQLSKAHAEAQQWRAKYEGEGLLRADEVEEQRRKILVSLSFPLFMAFSLPLAFLYCFGILSSTFAGKFARGATAVGADPGPSAEPGEGKAANAAGAGRRPAPSRTCHPSLGPAGQEAAGH
jgi:myosin heavy chain 6/7